MRFFTLLATHVAHSALLQGRYRLWQTALLLDGPNLVPAEQLAYAAASRDPGMLAVIARYYSDLMNSDMLEEALYAAAELGNFDGVRNILALMQAKGMPAYEPKHLLHSAAASGNLNCWKNVRALLNDSTPCRCHDEELLEMAFYGRNASILHDVRDMVSEHAFREQNWKAMLEMALEWKSLTCLDWVVTHGQGLSDDDYWRVQDFAMSHDDIWLMRKISFAMDNLEGARMLKRMAA